MGRNANDGRGRLGGRQKGTPNKVQSETQALLSQFAKEKFPDILAAFDDLESKDKITAYTSILRYVVPPARDIQADEDNNNATSDLIARLFNRDQSNNDDD